MSDAVQRQLYDLIAGAPMTCLEAAAKLKIPHEQVVAALKSLEAKQVLKSALQTRTTTVLTELGSQSVAANTPEYQLYQSIPACGIEKQLIQDQASIPGALRRKLIRTDASNGKDHVVIFKQAENLPDDVREQLLQFDKLPEKDIKMLKKSKFLRDETVKFFSIELGEVPFDVKLETELTLQMVQDQAQSLKFKQMNFNTKGKVPQSLGALHPLLQMRRRFVQILTAMGFEQMPTPNYVESSFWCFDALMIPQQHPARDAQDTFFVKGEFARYGLDRVAPAYLGGVRRQQEAMYRSGFSEAETARNVMRTHTTAVSARTLYALAQQRDFRPMKCFSIDRVYRNETLDATHLCEFCQVEGFVVDQNVSLADLMGTIKQFFAFLGFDDVRFKPAYNPYTEPSMEVFCYHKGLKRWIEVGNSGIFRPELMEPMGFKNDMQCIAWGLSLERPTMIQYQIDNIRDLVGPACNLDMILACEDCNIM